MRILSVLLLTLLASGCTRWSLDHHLNAAYRAYNRDNCEQALLDLSQADRLSRSRPAVQPEISLLRGQCLERQKLYVDAARTYDFIIARYPRSEYAYRARARLDTLEQLGHLRGSTSAVAHPASL
ncbi:tetratricopeptide repeat protein [Pseudomonas mangiferae]|uniref:Tetratricopeptide repeat protein n=1 Tax=Pseudomonas mangiferae TaxID=2593654 RepID=A0A553H0Y8_9PSED|nr:tetratricopeptide repeat protein [Pseudomonas mangiferae]TRX75408.1 tetratricopeptide repeat protein [Pseudomonas mangiferae]